MRELAGRKLGGRYLLARRIGVGTTSTVWEATDEVLQRTVAVKVINESLSADDAFVGQFRRQAMAAARLAGPGIVAIYDTVSEPGIDAVVMEHLIGMTLRDFLLKYAPLSAHDAVDLGRQVLLALESAHSAGVVHTQIQPETIILCDDRRVKLTDTGFLVMATTEEGPYVAPEVAGGCRPDPRSDVFSTGAVLYECLTGTIPFGSPPDAGQTPAAMATANVVVPPALEAAIARSLSVAPEARFQSAAEFRVALGQIDLRKPPPPLPDPETPQQEVGEGRSKLPALLAAGVATLVVLAGLALITTGTGRDAVRDLTEGFGLVGADDDPADTAADTDPQPPEAPADPTSTATSTAPAATDTLVLVSSAAFDPPPGSGSEHDEIVGLSIDGDDSTIWHSESYASREFGGLKDGIGLIVELSEPASIATVDVVSPSQGWSLEIYAAGEPAGDLAGWGEPVAGASAVAGNAQFDLGGTTIGALLVWVTDLGNDPAPVRIEIAEVRLHGTDVG